ncbi:MULTISPECIES: hypothetical protein [unclassified Haladaptatus]|uniref:hypothetical protein n=1 Tax=unclassified Haladaptatus TaxID=2622732 RepID=UPI00209C104E|nr:MULTISPECIES: hypothetical protein [unclassified Haladaptatus]MCO8243770.1 hypothetical protein [Haladaptatus sp. AB643]MCO8256711.1 hypothetical protein [Haladaptatus sp. AB618]
MNLRTDDVLMPVIHLGLTFVIVAAYHWLLPLSGMVGFVVLIALSITTWVIVQLLFLRRNGPQHRNVEFR